MLSWAVWFKFLLNKVIANTCLFILTSFSKQSVSWKVLEICELCALSTDSRKTYSVNKYMYTGSSSYSFDWGGGEIIRWGGGKKRKRPQLAHLVFIEFYYTTYYLEDTVCILIQCAFQVFQVFLCRWENTHNASLIEVSVVIEKQRQRNKLRAFKRLPAVTFNVPQENSRDGIFTTLAPSNCARTRRFYWFDWSGAMLLMSSSQFTIEGLRRYIVLLLQICAAPVFVELEATIC